MRRRATTAPDTAPGGAAGEPGQPDPEEKGPRRRCVVTRESLPKEAMIRFVLGPDRVLVPDLAGRMPGRGMWLSARGDVLERALTRGAFTKAARGPVHPIPELREAILGGLRRRIRDAVGLARRAGQAVVGFQQAREWLQAGRAALLVQASDGSASERSRLAGGHGLPVVLTLDAAELGLVFGRDHAVHVAIAPGKLASSILVEAGRLEGLLLVAPDGPGKGPRGGGRAPREGGQGPREGGQGPREGGQGRTDAGREAGRDRPASPDRFGSAGPSGAGQDRAPRRGADHRPPRAEAAVRAARGSGGPAPRKGGRQGTRPRRGGEPAVPVTQER